MYRITGIGSHYKDHRSTSDASSWPQLSEYLSPWESQIDTGTGLQLILNDYSYPESEYSC